MHFLSQRVKKVGINLPPPPSLVYALMGFLNQCLLASVVLPCVHKTETDTAGLLSIKTATSQAVIKVEPQLIAGGKFLFKCLHFFFLDSGKSVQCVYRDIIKEQKGSGNKESHCR